MFCITVTVIIKGSDKSTFFMQCNKIKEATKKRKYLNRKNGRCAGINKNSSLIERCFILPYGLANSDYIFSKHKIAIPKK
jgi:hypothetical protein